MLARKKHINFDHLSPENKKRIQIEVLNELIERDEKEMSTYNQNMETFNFRRGADDKVFRNKKNDKQKALVVKRELLRSLKRDLK
jgi:ABC-type Zn2+ transport system substrate-binding protein/surface adhesin